MSKQNRNPISQWFLTFPKCKDCTKLEFMNSLQKFTTITAYKCVRETHLDGSFHIHSIIKTEKGVSKPKFLQFLRKEFPDDWKRIHIEPIRSIAHSMAYVDKEDPSPLIFGDLTISRRGRPRKTYGRQPIPGFVPPLIEAKMYTFNRDCAVSHLKVLKSELKLMQQSDNERFPKPSIHHYTIIPKTILEIEKLQATLYPLDLEKS